MEFAMPQRAYRLAQPTELNECQDTLVLSSPYFRVMLPHLSRIGRGLLMDMATHPHAESEIDATILDSDGPEGLALFYYCLSYLAKHQMLHVSASHNGSPPLATLIPISPHFQQRHENLENCQYRISRFAYLRRSEHGLVLESPLSHCILKLEQPIACAILSCLDTPASVDEIAEELPGAAAEEISSVLALAIGGNFAHHVNSEGRTAEDDDETLVQWDFHDLLFHARSRMGRHNYRTGGNFRFLKKIKPQPAVKSSPSPFVQILPRPDLAEIILTDPPLGVVMEARASIRRYSDLPISITQLGEFLFRVARVKQVYPFEDKGELTKRPYPSGGASYEMEFYITVDKCQGVERGLYWYDPLHHSLTLVSAPNQEMEGLLNDAFNACARICYPQILITLAARFQRVSWKYDSMAYATVLKNVGVIYATMYLVATAMRLAPCALGLGNSDRFAHLAGTDYLKETSVGEFMLGSSPVSLR